MAADLFSWFLYYRKREDFLAFPYLKEII